MFTVIRLIAVLAVIGATADAQNVCTVEGLDSATHRDGVRTLAGTIAYGSQRGGVLLLEPIFTTHPSPPVLFAYSEVVIAAGRTDLHPMALQLARDGGTVLLLERPVFWEAAHDAATRNPRLLDCASDWLLSQNNLDLLHMTYVGPRIQDDDEKLRTPLAIANLKFPRRGGLRVPLADAETGSDILGFTEAETRERLLKAIEQHWLVPVLEVERSSTSTR
jgi:hypothetical protein